jgi:hypothetical protein
MLFVSIENVVREDVCDMVVDETSASSFESAIDRQVTFDSYFSIFEVLLCIL